MRHAIGERLLHVRANRTQPEMAREMGVAARTYSYYEQGQRVPDSEALALLVAQGWNANWLLTGEGPERLEALHSTPESKPQSHSQSIRLDRETLARAGRVLAMVIGSSAVDQAVRDQMLGDVYEHLIQYGFDGERLLQVSEGLRSQLEAIDARHRRGGERVGTTPVAPHDKPVRHNE